MDPHIDKNDGLDKILEGLQESQPFEKVYFTEPLLQNQPKRNVKMVVQMDQIVPSRFNFNTVVINPLAAVGTVLGRNTLTAAEKLPGLLRWGVSSFITKVTSFYQNMQTQPIKPEQNKEIFDPASEPILLVMPNNIIDGGLAMQLQWMEENKEKFQVINTDKKAVQLQSKDSESDSSHSDCCDADMRRISQEFKNFPESTEYYMISEQDYQTLNESISRNKEQHDNTQQQQIQIQELIPNQIIEEQQQLKKITLYPFLPSLITKEQFQKEQQQIVEEKAREALKIEQSVSFVQLEKQEIMQQPQPQPQQEQQKVQLQQQQQQQKQEQQQQYQYQNQMQEQECETMLEN